VLEEMGSIPGTVIVQFDAHLDVYNLTGCTTKPSHGNFLLHAQGPLPPIAHVGHRDLFLPAEHTERHFRCIVSPAELASSLEKRLRKLRKFVAKEKHF